MMNTVWAVVREGRIVPLEEIEAPEGTRVLVTLLSEEEATGFWVAASETSLGAVWDNAEDDVYAELLEE
jgi:hypothetical protein